ncbi:family 78 glycoside hydrolase catalytic domain [Paenibacillus sp. 1P07SE]|uniref:family 78 glycoside hydrolase catalytic domain n=1 Tax=Paenibacillus sp. 1P07SE TaxID=3132209 RepID=UPI0039A4EA93
MKPTIAALRCEYRDRPLGLDVQRPRFGWQLHAEGRLVRQLRYRLQTALDAQFAEIQWDSGAVDSDQSIQVAYDGPDLQPSVRYWYRVRAETTHGETGWSEPSWWETGLLSAERWADAQWIACPEEDPADSVHYLRGRIRTGGMVASARLYATALGIYRLQVNGRLLEDCLLSPGWTSYDKRLQYQTYDITELLTEDVQTVLCIVADGWYKGALTGKYKRNVYGDRKAMLLQLHVRYTDGKAQIWSSGETWEALQGPLVASSLYDGEYYDATRALEPAGSGRVKVLSASKHAIIGQEGMPVRETASLPVQKVLHTPAGETVLDFGQNLAGGVRFRVSGNPGDRVELVHGEVLDSEGNLYVDNLRSAKQRITYVCSGGEEETYQPLLSFQGFRYVRIEAYPGEVRPERFMAVVLHSDLESAGSFACSSKGVNQLVQNIRWSQRGNFIDIPMDCPQRDERLGWTGDAQVFARASSYLMHVAPFFSKWLRDLAADQRPDGGVPSVIPSVLEKHSAGGWGDAAVIVPWQMYVAYGDLSLLAEQYGSMKAWVEYIHVQGEIPGLYNTGFHYGDWLALDAREGSYKGATPDDLIATAFFAYSCELLGRAAGLLDLQEDELRYAELHAEVVRQFRRTFITPAGRLAAPTQTAHALTLYMNLAEARHRPRLLRDLQALVMDGQGKAEMRTGFIGTPYICHVLSEGGLHELACELVLREEAPSWLYAVSRGATTVWEHWDGIRSDGSFWSRYMNSFNHYAYGAIADWLYGVVAGISSEAEGAGFRQIRIAPRVGGGFTHASAVYRSMHGEIRSSWVLLEDNVELECAIPANTTAVITLYGTRKERVSESGLPLELADGIVAAHNRLDAAQITVGSGMYRFSYAFGHE